MRSHPASSVTPAQTATFDAQAPHAAASALRQAQGVLNPSKRVPPLRRTLIGPRAVAALADTFKVLGDGTRVRMLDALSRTEMCVGDLAALLGLTESAVSHQLRLLRSMRLVRSRRAGRMVFYMLDDDHIVKLFRQCLDHVEESWGSGPKGAGRAAARGRK